MLALAEILVVVTGAVNAHGAARWVGGKTRCQG